jgi:hypothetical protein
MAKVELSTALSSWLERVSAKEEPPKSVVAFNVGLLETEDGYSAYLVGADRFDEDDSDWACEESFTPKERYLAIPRGTFKKWEAVQAAVVDATRKFLTSAVGKKSFLAKAKAVTVGFDDGDLERVK